MLLRPCLTACLPACLPADSDALRQRIGLEQARVGELEGLLAVSRAEQYKRDAVAAEAGPERFVASLSEQKRLLEEQVTTLQRQVDGLVQVREEVAEQRSMARLLCCPGTGGLPSTESLRSS
jgi:hypothetical protein